MYQYENKLIFGNKESNVGIATLWTTTEFVASTVDASSYCIIGNFYDVYNGIEPLVRNCLFNTKIRYILVVGRDRSGSKHTLVQFFKEGVENGFIKGTQVPFTSDIPIEDINILRSHCKLIDLTPLIKDIDCKEEYTKIITETLQHCPPLPAYREGKLYKITEYKPDTLPSSGTAFKVEGALIGETWLKILKEIKTYGSESKMGVDSPPIRECINLLAVISDEDPDMPTLPSYMIFDKEYLIKYYKTFCEGELPKDTAYTYGSRFSHQFDDLYKKLKVNPDCSDAYITTWLDGDMISAVPPCVISIQLNIINSKLYLTAYMRSNDMFRAWPLNAFGLRKIQKNFAQRLNIEMGTLSTFSHSAHIYNENFKDMDKILEVNYKPHCEDINLQYTIKVDNKIYLSTPDGEYEGGSAREILDTINGGMAIKNKYHIAYLAKELTKAEYIFKKNIDPNKLIK